MILAQIKMDEAEVKNAVREYLVNNYNMDVKVDQIESEVKCESRDDESYFDGFSIKLSLHNLAMKPSK